MPKYPGSLHNHTDFSNLRLRDCIIQPKQLIDYAIELGHSVVGITDHETISGWVKIEEYYEKIKETNPDFKIIRGNEIYLCRNGLNSTNYTKDVDYYYHFCLYAKDLIGAKQIFEISTRAWERSYFARGMRRVPTYYQDLFDIIGANSGHVVASTACFREGTMVETKEGWKPIEYIQKGDYVLNRYGEWEEVIEPTCNWYNGWMYKIKLSGNENPIICTENHQFLTITGNSKIPKWTQAKDLIIARGNTKHICLRPFNKSYPFKDNFIINKKEFLHSYFSDSNYSHKSYILPEQVIITPELMRLFGLFLGDGCLSLKKNPRLSFTLNIKEFETYYQSFIREAGKQLGIVWSINRREKNNCVDITSSCVELIDLFYWLFGDVKASNKYIPERLKISDELSYELIFGYLLADGYFRIRKPTETIKYPTGEFVTASISKRLSYDFYELLNQLGITTNISYSQGGYRNNCNHQDSWYLEGSNKFIGNLCKTKQYTHNDIVKCFNDAIQYKKKDFCVIDSIHYRKIRIKDKKIQLSHEYVYCLNNTTHSFKCENAIVHNCLGGALPTQILKGTPDKKLGVWITQLKDLFGKENFYLEMQPNTNAEQIKVNRKIYDLARAHDVEFIITTDSHYLKKSDAKFHKNYLRAQNGDREVDDFYATTYLMDTKELEDYMTHSFKDLEIACKAYASIQKIADMCEDFTLRKPLKIPNLKWRVYPTHNNYSHWFKKIPYLETFYNSPHESDKELVDAVISGIESHPDLQNTEAYRELEDNLEKTWVSSEVNKTRWSSYYLNLQYTLDECWNAGTIIGPGRGSGVGFLLLYCLDIIQVNKLREKTPTFSWRFLNPSRVSVLDIDVDIESAKRAQVLNHFRDIYGADRVANVATFRTETTKSALLTACRGLGYDVDIGQYLSSLVPSDRGTIRSLAVCMYGDKENDLKPVKQFVTEMTYNYPDIWEMAVVIEGLISGYGSHAGGIIFVDEPFTNSTALLRAPDGTIATQFELDDCEKVSLIKMDLLSVDAMDKIHTCIDLLCEYGYAERKDSLKETYESIVGVYNLERDDPKMWKLLHDHKITSIFQVEKLSGIQGIAISKPQSVDDLAIVNSAIRLMSSEKGAELPLHKFARFKNDISFWRKEMEDYGLTVAEQELLRPLMAPSYGLCITQEQFMSVVQIPEVGGFDLQWSDRLRKAVAKKHPKDFLALEEEFYENMRAKGLRANLCEYVWKEFVRPNAGYGFNASHTLAYSLIALQEMNLAHKYPIIFWNCACLISGAGGTESSADDSIETEVFEEEYDDFVEDFVDEVDADDEDDEDEKTITTKKKKPRTVNYGKIAALIGTLKASGGKISPPNINQSSFTFSPDVPNDTILYGLAGITRIGENLINLIFEKRPFSSVDDFLKRVKVNKPQMVNLIKSGAFDQFGARHSIMEGYIASISEPKKRITLQNMKMLIDFGLLPQSLEFEIKVYNFNKYLKKFKDKDQYLLDLIAYDFFSKNFDVDLLTTCARAASGLQIKQSIWEKIYQANMDKVRPYVKANNALLLQSVNYRLFQNMWEKYASGTQSKWEMDSISCYIEGHELDGVDLSAHEVENFYDLSDPPTIERFIPIKGRMIPIYKLARIAGTVLDRDKMKKLITLLTTEGVVTVKAYGVFANYDKQISERRADGTKKVIRKSEFTRGNKIILTGIREGENEFRCKKYAVTPYHTIETIDSINNNEITLFNRNDKI